ncbi:MAG TPA: hypothetical protein VLS93_15735 [Anaeromyxobacteraceae bacterium]|nr:hypothetical protein [Anaeromyxobacteraceae bacterium]
MNGPAPAPVCRWLRARSAYGRSADGIDWRTGESTLESYSCLLTQEPSGPDDGLAHARTCRPGRTCFAGEGT